MAQVVEILPHIRQEPTHSTSSIQNIGLGHGTVAVLLPGFAIN